MKCDKPTRVAGTGFDLTDTVLAEIDTLLAKKIAEASTGDSSDFDFDFDAALKDDKPA